MKDLWNDKYAMYSIAVHINARGNGKRHRCSAAKRLLHEVAVYAGIHELQMVTIFRLAQKAFRSRPFEYADV